MVWSSDVYSKLLFLVVSALNIYFCYLCFLEKSVFVLDICTFHIIKIFFIDFFFVFLFYKNTLFSHPSPVL